MKVILLVCLIAVATAYDVNPNYIIKPVYDVPSGSASIKNEVITSSNQPSLIPNMPRSKNTLPVKKSKGVVFDSNNTNKGKIFKSKTTSANSKSGSSSMAYPKTSEKKKMKFNKKVKSMKKSTKGRQDKSSWSDPLYPEQWLKEMNKMKRQRAKDKVFAKMGNGKAVYAQVKGMGNNKKKKKKNLKKGNKHASEADGILRSVKNALIKANPSVSQIKSDLARAKKLIQKAKSEGADTTNLEQRLKRSEHALKLLLSRKSMNMNKKPKSSSVKPLGKKRTFKVKKEQKMPRKMGKGKGKSMDKAVSMVAKIKNEVLSSAKEVDTNLRKEARKEVKVEKRQLMKAAAMVDKARSQGFDVSKLSRDIKQVARAVRVVDKDSSKRNKPKLGKKTSKKPKLGKKTKNKKSNTSLKKKKKKNKKPSKKEKNTNHIEVIQTSALKREQMKKSKSKKKKTRKPKAQKQKQQQKKKIKNVLNSKTSVGQSLQRAKQLIKVIDKALIKDANKVDNHVTKNVAKDVKLQEKKIQKVKVIAKKFNDQTLLNKAKKAEKGANLIEKSIQKEKNKKQKKKKKMPNLLRKTMGENRKIKNSFNVKVASSAVVV